MRAEDFMEILGADFYTGVPDSQLKALCSCLQERYGSDGKHHVIAANEGNCTGVAAGYYLATGKVPVVYMQNSGEGNIINPVASLLHEKVYGIPVIFVVGWRGEPGVHDEPQHVYQGEVTLKLLEDMQIPATVVDPDTTTEELRKVQAGYEEELQKGHSVAYVIKKGALSYEGKVKYANAFSMNREEVLKHIIGVSGTDTVVSTTGKISREIFEIREARGEGHGYDFLTVGSMGHASSIALGIALQKESRVWCIDGDGAVLMHMGSMAVTGAKNPTNMIHVVLNNEAHETVGGMPTAASAVELTTIARGAGYAYVAIAEDFDTLDLELQKVKEMNALCFIEVRCALGSRADLGRPTTTPVQNRDAFMKELGSKE